MISRPSANGKQNPSGTVPPAAAQLHPAVGGEGHPLCLQHRPLDAGAKCWGGGAVGTHHPVAGHAGRQARMAWPTAREALGLPSIRASCP